MEHRLLLSISITLVGLAHPNGPKLGEVTFGHRILTYVQIEDPPMQISLAALSQGSQVTPLGDGQAIAQTKLAGKAR